MGESPTEHARRVTHLAVARAVYGLIIVIAVLEVMELHPPEAGWEGAELLVGTVLTVALAEFYADLIAGTFVHNKRPSGSELAVTGRDAVPLLIGAPLPMLVLVLSALGLVEVRRAIDAAQVLAYTTLLIYGWTAVRRLEGGVAPRLVGGLTIAAIGFVLVALKVAFH